MYLLLPLAFWSDTSRVVTGAQVFTHPMFDNRIPQGKGEQEVCYYSEWTLRFGNMVWGKNANGILQLERLWIGRFSVVMFQLRPLHSSRQLHLTVFSGFLSPNREVAVDSINFQKLSKEMFWPLSTPICCRIGLKPCSLPVCKRVYERGLFNVLFF